MLLEFQILNWGRPPIGGWDLAGCQQGQHDHEEGTERRPGERVVHAGMEEDGDDSESPDSLEPQSERPGEQQEHGDTEGDAALGGPLQPVAMRLIGI